MPAVCNIGQTRRFFAQYYLGLQGERSWFSERTDEDMMSIAYDCTPLQERILTLAKSLA
jgi:hypothetical protein